MNTGGRGSVSGSESYYFQLIPSYFKVQHGFAKTIRPNTNYRLSIFKGIQRIDEMGDPIKGKLVGGKILFDQHPLSFYLPLYTPARNIEFTVKVLESRPNEAQAEIASHKVKSGDFIKKFKDEGSHYSKEEVPLLDNLSLVFELFVHNSKLQLDKIIKDYQHRTKTDSRNNIAANRGKTPKKNQASSQIHSQSDNLSETGSRDGGQFASKKKLTRKRGHDGKLRSKHGSRENSEAGSSRSRSSRKSFGPFPHNEQNEHYVHSPKKLSPPKVEETEVKPEGKKENLVTVARKDSQNSEIRRGDRNVGTPRTKGNQPQTERAQSARKSEIYSRGATRNSLPGKRGSQSGVHELQIVTSQNMFDIEKRNQGRTKLRPQQEAPKSTSKPPLPPKSNEDIVSGDMGNQQDILRERQTLSNQKFNQTAEAKEEPKIEAKQQEGREASTKSKEKAPSIAVKGQALQNPDERGATEVKMKASIHLSNANKNEQDAEEAANKEYTGMKDTLFYVVFTIVSLLLFWNAITPSRKV